MWESIVPHSVHEVKEVRQAEIHTVEEIQIQFRNSEVETSYSWIATFSDVRLSKIFHWLPLFVDVLFLPCGIELCYVHVLLTLLCVLIIVVFPQGSAFPFFLSVSNVFPEEYLEFSGS